MNEYAKLRNKAVSETILKNDLKIFKKFCLAHTDVKDLPSDEILIISLMKTACNSLELDEKVVDKARKWLRFYDYKEELF